MLERVVEAERGAADRRSRSRPSTARSCRPRWRWSATSSSRTSARRRRSRTRPRACGSAGACSTRTARRSATCSPRWRRRRADYGVVPIENSTDGAVTHTLDQFADTSLKICAEIYLPISHSLMAKVPREQIKRIYSKPRGVRAVPPLAAREHAGRGADLRCPARPAAAEMAAARAGERRAGEHAGGRAVRPEHPRAGRAGPRRQHDAVPRDRQELRQADRQRQDVACSSP